MAIRIHKIIRSQGKCFDLLTVLSTNSVVVTIMEISFYNFVLDFVA